MEMRRDMPLLFQCCVAIMSNPRDTCKVPHMQQIMPKLGMIYAILLQQAVPGLSKVERVMTVLLQDSFCDQRVSFRELINY